MQACDHYSILVIAEELGRKAVQEIQESTGVMHVISVSAGPSCNLLF